LANEQKWATSFREKEVTVIFKRSKPHDVLVVRFAIQSTAETKIMASFSRRLASQFLRYSLTNWKLQKRLKRCIGGTTFVEVLKTAEMLPCAEKFLKSRFIVVGKSAIAVYISLVLTEKIIF